MSRERLPNTLTVTDSGGEQGTDSTTVFVAGGPLIAHAERDGKTVIPTWASGDLTAPLDGGDSLGVTRGGRVTSRAFYVMV